MKIYSPSTLSIIALAVITLLACVADDKFELPESEPVQFSPLGQEISIEALKAALMQEIANNGNSLLRIENELFLSGYVISNDEHGNFFEELIIQSDTIGETEGLKILIDVNPLFQYFEVGRKIYVQLEGLTVGLHSEQPTLGYRDGNSLGAIAESRLFHHLLRDSIVGAIHPEPVDISGLTDEMINTFIQLQDVQFNRFEVLGDRPLTYAGEPEDEFDGERLLESCMENTSIVFSTSTFADFKNVSLPVGRGNVQGVFTYNFFGDEFNIVVNGPEDVMFTQTERCDPLEVDCGLASEGGKHILFSEYFETQTVGDPISGNGWTNFTEVGSASWEAYFDDGSNASLGISARMGSYMSGDDSNIGWLISPQIDFDTQEGETLNFKTSNSFADGSTLELWFSQDWDGNPLGITQATWNLLPAAIIVADDDFFGDWIFSGYVDLSCIDGVGYIAWKYVGSGGADFDGTYELDEIEIRSE